MRESLTQNISMARFANVAFSDGSLFTDLIKGLQSNNQSLHLMMLSAISSLLRNRVSYVCSGLLGENRDIFFPKLSENCILLLF